MCICLAFNVVLGLEINRHTCEIIKAVLEIVEMPQEASCIGLAIIS
jgi:hypothetical protein